MRGVLLALALAAAVVLVAPQTASAALGSAGTTMTAAATTSADLQQPATLDITVSHSGRWYASPMWIAIGAIAGVLVLLMIVLIARSGSSGGTTVVK
jgi:hypothetical protein